MRENLSTILGFYLPAFFKMKVNVPESLTNLDLLSDFHLAIYFHEYIHYIQDISTTYGLMNSIITVDYIKSACKKIINIPFNFFNPPILPDVNDPDNVRINLDLSELYQGSVSEFDGLTINSVNKLYKKIDFPDGSRDVPYIQVEHISSCKSNGAFSFGAYCLMESMAYLAETIIFPNCLSAPQIPYSSAELLGRKLYPKFSMNKENILALCDIALCTYPPGPFYYDMLIRMKSDDWLPNNPQDIYTYCFNPKDCYKGLLNLERLLLDTSKEAMKQLCDYFTIDIFKDNINWIEYIINTAVNLRCANPSFIIDIVRGGHIKNNNSYIDLFRKVGTPMITNILNEGTFNCPIQDQYDIRPQLFWVINQILKIFLNEQTCCELKGYCQRSSIEQKSPDFTDETCDNSPWEKALEDQLCFFGQVWRSWGLSNKKPEQKKTV